VVLQEGGGDGSGEGRSHLIPYYLGKKKEKNPSKSDIVGEKKKKGERSLLRGGRYRGIRSEGCSPPMRSVRSEKN